MNKTAINYVKSFFSAFGLFVARRYPNAVNGHDLTYDLKVVVRKENPLCFDIGANRGQTIELLQSCFRNPTIHAFEPSSATFTTLSSQSFGPQVTLHQLALGDQAGVATFRNYTQSELSSFLPVNTNKSENIFAEEALILAESVQVNTLDSFCAAQGIEQIDLLKIDTQGFELPVLRGGADLFKNQRIGAVLLELNFSPLYEGQSDPLEILALMRTHNMRLVDYYEKERASGMELSWTTALFMRYP
ncbi:FkbM family methyltransferase [Spirosoma sp. HMF3257]|uniref:FkbM family methyltransferase n=1 Tax=Spirosoma telluris TaxID=2183553 RepID=A0A327NHQ3_9BACT|nr:FkbM family methyltransferase [Spirosoma telluris]RAI74910.1 FkbM family methyltransferase [Spirosoma telluris]